MKKINYVTKEGKEGVSNELEHGDVFITKQAKPKKFEGKFVNYILEATYNGEDMDINLKKSQGEFFDRFDVAPGTELRGENYTNSYGTFVGIAFNKPAQTKEEKIENTNNLLKQAEENLVTGNDEGITLTDKEQDIYNQIGKIAEKDRSKVTKDAFISTMTQMAEVTTERATEIYEKMFI